MKFEKVLHEMYEISTKMNMYVNGGWTSEEQFWYLGKKYKNKDNIVKKALENLERKKDFRNENVDKESAEYVKNAIVERINSFCKENIDGDLQTMLIGCVLNLYYTSGLFDRVGRLPMADITRYIIDCKTKEYILCQEKIVLSIVGSYFFKLCEKGLFTFTGEEYNYFLKRYLNSDSNQEKSENMKSMLMGINPDAKLATPFVEQIIKDYKLFAELKNYEVNKIIKELYSIKSSYQYAKLLMSIEAVKNFVNTRGEDTSFLEYLEFLDEELIDIGMGLRKPSTFKAKYENGHIDTEHPECCSIFGLGVPHIDYILKDEWYRNNRHKPKGKIHIDDSNDIRKELENAIGLPCVIVADLNIMQYIVVLAAKLNKSEKQKDRALEERKKIVNQFSHTYMGMRATSLYNIAMELMKRDEIEFKNFGRKLLYEYSVKKNLTRDVEMLKLRFEDKKQELCDKISSSILESGQVDGVGIDKLINDALIRCMVTLVHDAGQSAKRLRARFENCDWIEVRNNFENDILLAEDKDIINWFSKNMFSMSYSISELWKSFFYEEDSYAALLITDLLTELTINIFKYADKTKPVNFEFKEDENNMLIIARNYINKTIIKDIESGYGLEAEGDVIRVLNEMNGNADNSIIVKTENNIFYATVQICKKIFKK